jgi:ligand-binding sensor domain-containing protein
MKFLANRKFSINFRPKNPARKLLFATVIILICGFVLLLAEARIIYRKTEQTLEKERSKQLNQAKIAFAKVNLPPHIDKNVQILQSPKSIRAIVHFQNSIFAATDGGLLQMSETGEILRHWTVLDGLPESDLTSLAVFQSRLFIGTKSKGLINFDGENFESFRLQNHETKAITTLFTDSRTIFIGTFSGGLIEFDGKNLCETKAVESRIEHITFLQKDDSQLVVGTFDQGLWLRRGDIWKNFTTADGLLSNRVVEAEFIGEKFFVATDFGVSQAFNSELFQESQKVFRQIAVLPTLSSLIVVKQQIYLTKDDGEIFTFSADGRNSDAPKIQNVGWKKPEKLETSRLFKTKDEIWFTSNQGIWKSSASDTNSIALSAFGNFSDENFLTENTVSAITIDTDKRLWIGTFRGGIDVFSSSGKKLKHLENETIREINFLAQNADNKTISAATSKGIVNFDSSFNSAVSKDEFPSRSIAQISLQTIDKKQTSAVAASKGLAVKTDNIQRIYSTLNGLPSNSIYTTLFARNALFVGTLGGLAQIENGKVVRVYKTSNSELKNNWITALSLAADRIFIGTYGGGVYELLPSGEIRSFKSEIGDVFVNQNAMFADENRLFVGTLKGLLCLDLTTQKWTNMTEILPSETVLSIAGNDETIFVGTTGGVAQINKNYWTQN